MDVWLKQLLATIIKCANDLKVSNCTEISGLLGDVKPSKEKSWFFFLLFLEPFNFSKKETTLLFLMNIKILVQTKW